MMHYLLYSFIDTKMHAAIACGLELNGPHGESATPQINLVNCQDCKKAIAMAQAVRDRPKGRPTKFKETKWANN